MLRSFVTDLNGDGAPDLVFEGTNGVPSEVFLNDGHGHFNLAYSLSGTAQIEAVATVNKAGATAAVTVGDSAANVAANLDGLQAMTPRRAIRCRSRARPANIKSPRRAMARILP